MPGLGRKRKRNDTMKAKTGNPRRPLAVTTEKAKGYMGGGKIPGYKYGGGVGSYKKKDRRP